MNKKYTKENLELLIKDCKSIADLIRKLNLKCSGGSHSHLSKQIKKYNIDISHFTGKPHNANKKSMNRKSWTEILTLKENGSREKSYKLRRALIEAGIKYSCQECGISNMWNNKTITLQVDHINGNFLDNTINNLRFLCPNCHSQTIGYNGSKGLTDLTDVNRYNRNYNRVRKIKLKNLDETITAT